MDLTKWMKQAGAEGFSSAAKMKWRAYSKCMGAINLHLKLVKLADKVTFLTLTVRKETSVGL
jgi:hypothetical protein